MIQLTFPPTNRKAKSKAAPHLACPGVPWEHSTRGGSCNERWVPHSSPVFGLEWDTQHSTTPQSRSCVIRSEGEGPAVLSTSSRSNGAPHPGFPVKFVGVDELHRKSGDVGYHNSPPSYPACQGVPWEQSTCLWQLEKEMTQQNSPRVRGPEGRLAKLQPSPEGLGINPEEDTSAVGAALNPASTCVIPRPQP